MPNGLAGSVKLGTSNAFDWVFPGISVKPDAIWELGADEVIKIYSPTSGYRIFVYGTLRVNTTADQPVIFTSLADNEYGYPSGSGTPDKGYWDGIYISATGTAVLDHAVIRYGGPLVEVAKGGSLTLTNSTLEHSSTYGVKVSSSLHYISGNYFYDITSYGVYNANTDEIVVRAENNWWGDASGPNPYGIGYGINYRMCQDPYTGNYYICEYYVDAVPWIGQDIGESEDLIDEELPDDPNRNTAPMEPGVPYIKSVNSTMNFFYFRESISDTIRIEVDWNGSDEGFGTPGVVLIEIDGVTSWEDQYVTGISEKVSYQFNPNVINPGIKEMSFTALLPDGDAPGGYLRSKKFSIRLTKFLAPSWLLNLGFDDAPCQIHNKPSYTEYTCNFTIPKEYKTFTMAQDGIPVVNKTTPLQIQWDTDFKVRDYGYLEIDSDLEFPVWGKSTTRYGDVVGDIVETTNLTTSAIIFFNGKGSTTFTWDGEISEIDVDLGLGLAGKIAYKESLLTLIPGFGQAIAAIGRLPGGSAITNVIYGEVKLEPNLEVNTGFTADSSDTNIDFTSKGLSASGGAKLTFTLGIELLPDKLEANVYTGGQIGLEFCLDPEIAWKKTTGALFIGAELIVFDMFRFNPEQRWDYVKVSPTAGNCLISSTGSSSLPYLNSFQKESVWHVDDPTYGDLPYSEFNKANQKDTNTNINGSRLMGLSDDLLISNLYKNPDPSLTINGDKEIIVWVHDDLDLGNTQSKELMTSYWDGVSWSEPHQITKNLFVDFSPHSQFIDQDHVMVIWQQIKDSTIPDDATLTPEIGQKIELMYSVYDIVASQWTVPEYITDNNALDHSINLMVSSDGALMTTWIQNSDGQLLGDSVSPDQLKYAIWNGTSWSVGDVTNTQFSSLYSYDASLNNSSEGVLVLSHGQNENLQEMNELELYYTEWNGIDWSELTRLTDNSFYDDSPSVFYTSLGEKRLLWLQENEIMMLEDDWTLPPSTSQLVRDDYRLRNFTTVVDNGDNIAILWSGVSNEGSDLYYSLFDSDSQSWLLAERLTESSAVEKQISASFDASGKVLIAYVLDNYFPENIERDGVIYNDVMQYQSTDLHILQYTPDSDLNATNLHLPYRPNPEPGETVLVRADISNVGDWSVENPSISFYDGDPELGGLLIGSYTHTGYVAAGTSVTTEVNWTIPADSTTAHTVFAVVDPGGLINERDETNNRTSLITILPDLSVSSVSSYYYDQGRVIPLAVIYNSGKLSAENVLVEFRDGAVDGPVVYSEIVPLIEKEGMVAVSTEINATSWIPGSYQYFVTVDSLDEIDEVDEANNSDYFAIKVMPDLVIYAGDITATIEEGVGGSVNVTLRNWGTAPGENIIVSLYEGPDIDLTRTPLHTWTVPSLAVDEVTTLSTTIDHIPYHLFAVADPESIIEEIDESNNVSFEELPVVHGGLVNVVGSVDPNLSDIVYVASNFENDTGSFANPVQANLFDTNNIVEDPTLCDISLLGSFTGLQDKIVLIEKTDVCSADVQINNAATLGALAVLIYNNLEGGNVREAMTGPAVSIPSGFLARQDGLDLLSFHEQQVIVASEYEPVTILDPY